MWRPWWATVRNNYAKELCTAERKKTRTNSLLYRLNAIKLLPFSPHFILMPHENVNCSSKAAIYSVFDYCEEFIEFWSIWPTNSRNQHRKFSAIIWNAIIWVNKKCRCSNIHNNYYAWPQNRFISLYFYHIYFIRLLYIFLTQRKIIYRQRDNKITCESNT